MEKSEFFSYSWHIDEDETERTVIRIYGLNSKNESVCVIVNNFLPYFYLELPANVEWDESRAGLVASKLNNMLQERKPVTYELVFKKRLYYANVDSKQKRRLYPYLRCCCSHTEDIRQLGFKIRKPINIPGIGAFNLKMHEHNANPILQLTSLKKLPTAGWIAFAGKRIKGDDQISHCKYEYNVKWENMTEKPSTTVARPLLMGYDIEVNSSIPSSMPKAHRPKDKIFQISCVFGRQGCKPDAYERYLLTLGEPDTDVLGDNIEVLMYETEPDLLLGFVDLIQEKQPNVCIGYNIFTFDIPYMIERAKTEFCSYDFDRQGMNKYGHAKERTIEWSSSAYKNQSFQFLDAEGRIFVDLLPLVRRDYKMNNYQLKTIASHFLKDMTKDPLDAKAIFKCYRLGMKGGSKGKKALGVVGKYCLAEGTEVTGIHGTTKIEDLKQSRDFLLSWDEQSNKIVESKQVNFFNNGFRECVELELEDGTTITCTPDHKISLNNSEWKEAGDIPIGTRVNIGPILPYIGIETREMVISRLLGYILSDGHLGKQVCQVYTGNIFDAKNIAKDIEKLCGIWSEPKQDRNCWKIYIPSILAYEFRAYKGVTIGNRTKSGCGLPDFSEWENKNINEFLGGLFGGDGWCACLAKKDRKFSPIGLTQSRSSEKAIVTYMNTLQKLLLEREINSSIRIKKRDSLYIGSLIIPHDDNEKFLRSIGYRYCYHKTLRTSICVYYQRLRSKTINGYKNLYEKICEQKSLGKSISAAYKENIKNVLYPPTYGTVKGWINKGFPTGRSDQACRTFPKADDFIQKIGAEKLFEKGENYHTYAIGKNDRELPVFSLELTNRKNVGVKQVYDIEVANTHSFLANGIVVHNCVKDSELVVRLFETLTTWIALCEMSKVTNVPIFQLYTQGQQLKVFSQAYKKCTHENTIVEKDGYMTKEQDHYVGATVFPPVPGVYDKVVPFDFSSLYPTTIIAYNISWDTLVEDEKIPDEFCNVMEWHDHIGCIVEGTPVTVGEISVPIEQLIKKDRKLLAYNEERKGLEYYTQTNFFYQGVKECIELIFEDGTTLCCTPDHKILLSNGNWVEAQNIKISQDKIVCGYKSPCYDISEKYGVVIGDFTLYGEQALRFYRLLGMAITDGHMTHNRTMIYCGHEIDRENIIKDLDALLPNSYNVHIQNHGWGITLLGKLGKLFRNLEGIVWGSKKGLRKFPKLLQHASVPELRSFLSGLFGGDGHTFSISKSSGSLGSISLSWSSENEYELTEPFMHLQEYMLKCGIRTTVYRTQKSTHISVLTEDTLKFQETIGFAYCVHKSMRLEAGCSYLRLRQSVWDQQIYLTERVRKLKSEMSIEDATRQAIKELAENFPIYNSFYANPSKTQMVDLLRNRKKLTKSMFSRENFPTPSEYMDHIGAKEFFCSYSVPRGKQVLPCLYKKIIYTKNIGKRRVYDLEVKDSHSFIANGIVVHNCVHDPKEIRKAELNKEIKEKDAELKEMRKERDLKKNKDRKEDFKIKIAEFIKSTKPLRDERSQLNKSKPKHIICCHRKYRWLKKPLGVLPEILTHLLDTRSATKKEMKAVKAKLKEMKEGTDEYAETATYHDVLDQRQLALKVSANSGYGCMGVRRGYLPFMPGAMCTTYMGRKAIEKAAASIQKDWKGVLVYGDTDSNYVNFPHLQTAAECWDYSIKVAAEVSKLFPKPIDLVGNRRR